MGQLFLRLDSGIDLPGPGLGDPVRESRSEMHLPRLWLILAPLTQILHCRPADASWRPPFVGFVAERADGDPEVAWSHGPATGS
jgi:hypothetical protein